VTSTNPLPVALSTISARLRGLLDEVAETPYRERGEGWGHAIRGIYAAIAACDVGDSLEAYAALDEAQARVGRCESFDYQTAYCVVVGLRDYLEAVETEDAALEAEAQRRIRSWAYGGGPIIGEVA
jgi:hypothetical protein